MRNLIKAVIVCLVCFAGINVQAQTQEVVIKTAVFCDHCAECGSCKPRIEKDLFGVDGVKSAKLDVKTQTIKVVYNSKKTDVAKLRQAIAKSGFDADDVKADPVSYANLDECCKKK